MRSTAGPYRATPKDERIKLLPFELARAPSADEEARLLQEWHAAKTELAEADDDEEIELRLTWLAAVLSAAHVKRGDRRSERACLETAWSRVRRPIHRATIAARLARKATREGDLDRAEAWLATIHPTKVAEVDADVSVAQAVLAQARGADARALEIVGAPPSSRVIQGNPRILAALVRVSVLEQRTDTIGARRAHAAAVREHGAGRLEEVALRLDLARKTKTPVVLASVAVVTAITVLVLAFIVATQ